MNSGDMKQQMIPMLIPKVQNTAIAESSRISPWCDIHWMPKALSTENNIPEKIGLIPKYTPKPMPPKEAWVIPPLMNTSRRVTIYVPMKPHRILAINEPISAF
jgi:hypothetical protein